MDIFAFRAIERIIIIVGGMLFAYLGYKLFIFGVKEGTAKLQAESQFIKITFSGTGPGLFFMAFGAIILITALYTGNVFQIKPTSTGMGQIVGTEDPARIDTKPSRGQIVGTGDPARIDTSTVGEAVRRGKSITGGGGSVFTTRSGRDLIFNLNPIGPSIKVSTVMEGLGNSDPTARIKAIRSIVELGRSDELSYVIKDLNHIAEHDEDNHVREVANEVLDKL